jgi:hypothetical protein
MPESEIPPLPVHVTREPFCEWFNLEYRTDDSPTPLTEELDPDETRDWFKKRGADMDKIEKMLDYVWNFYRADVVIEKPKKVELPMSKIQPRI